MNELLTKDELCKEMWQMWYKAGLTDQDFVDIMTEFNEKFEEVTDAQ